MRYRVYGLRAKRWVRIGESSGLHAQAAILAYRKATGVGGQMRAERLDGRPTDMPSRDGITTPLTCEPGNNAYLGSGAHSRSRG